MYVSISTLGDSIGKKIANNIVALNSKTTMVEVEERAPPAADEEGKGACHT
jgi:hypothetical protein